LATLRVPNQPREELDQLSGHVGLCYLVRTALVVMADYRTEELNPFFFLMAVSNLGQELSHKSHVVFEIKKKLSMLVLPYKVGNNNIQS